MASVKKFPASAVVNQIRHCERTIQHPSNSDIDPSRTALNYSLTPVREMSSYEYYKHRKSELYCYNHANLKPLAGWIVTAPKELSGAAAEKAFFRSVYDFLENRYGKENVICATVHYDEGIKENAVDRFGTPVLDNSGKPIQKIVYGRPHLHFDFIPVSPDRNPKHPQSEKICAYEVLTKNELKRFHSDLQKHLQDAGIDVSIQSGITKKQGGNKSVSQLKTESKERNSVERERNRW